MNLAALALFSLEIVCILGAPLYLQIRGHMSAGRLHKYSKKRILKDVFLHFFMMVFIIAHFIVMIYSFLTGDSPVSKSLLFSVSLEVAFLEATFYGSGMYIASILFEAATKKNFQIIRLIHGPISHGIMYGAILGSFGNLGNILKETSTQAFDFPLYVFLLLGIFGGYSASISAISSGISYLYCLLSLIIGLIFVFTSLNLQNPYFIHFLGFCVTSFIVCFLFSLLQKKKNKRIIWYKPINFANIKI